MGLSQNVIQKTAQAIQQCADMESAAKTLKISVPVLMYRIREHEDLGKLAQERRWYLPRKKQEALPKPANNISGKGQSEPQNSHELKPTCELSNMLEPSNEQGKSYMSEKNDPSSTNSDAQDSELYKIKLERLRSFPQFDPRWTTETMNIWLEAFTITARWIIGDWPEKKI